MGKRIKKFLLLLLTHIFSYSLYGLDRDASFAESYLELHTVTLKAVAYILQSLFKPFTITIRRSWWIRALSKMDCYRQAYMPQAENNIFFLFRRETLHGGTYQSFRSWRQFWPYPTRPPGGWWDLWKRKGSMGNFARKNNKLINICIYK